MVGITVFLIQSCILLLCHKAVQKWCKPFQACSTLLGDGSNFFFQSLSYIFRSSMTLKLLEVIDIYFFANQVGLKVNLSEVQTMLIGQSLNFLIEYIF